MGEKGAGSAAAARAEPPVRSFRRELRGLEREVGLALSDQSDCCGVTPAQCHLLLAVEEAGETSVGELSELLELDRSTLSRAVDGLVKARLLLRREDPANRRRQRVSLSAAGRAKAKSINSVCDAYYEGLLGSLPTKDTKALVAALPLLVGAMRDWRRSQGPAGSCPPPKGGSR